ncbi:MAG: family 65 glycosyl hydrolase [Firmicutes bacterium HGW-Firmicutes-1]|jgi:alpha,alpha-trehalose phosphorylase|nr:MAG: family 65 glycosyl hydrolase [Firmicutes bacterium HGW-Firmicutes-1]
MKHDIKENEILKDELIINESIFAIGNGYLGVRGNFEEGYLDELPTIRGTYINAFHDVVDITYAEKAYGFPDTMQKLLNIIDSQGLIIELEDGEIVSPLTGKITNYTRTLDMKKGYVTRSFTYFNQKNEALKISYKRMVSFKQLELFVIHLEIEPISYLGEVMIKSNLNGDVYNYTDKDDPRVASGHSKLLNIVSTSIEDHLSIQVKTSHSGLSCSCVSTLIGSRGKEDCQIVKFTNSKQVEEVHKFKLNEKTSFTKYTIYTDSLRHQNPLEESNELLTKVKEFSFEYWIEEQTKYLADFWKSTYIDVKGEKSIQEGLQFNIFQLLQSVGKDKYSNISAKGLTGEGYEGHYFWDTEILIFPVFLLTNPEIAKNLLMYRYNILEQAKERAMIMGHKRGALFPWRTISGTECSGYFPAGTAQYHISGDIAYAFISYYLATNDIQFMRDFGAEVLFETARLWVDMGHQKGEHFYIDSVTGPDEYTAIVNNNYYTNTIAKYNLYWANKIYIELMDCFGEVATTDLLTKLDVAVLEIQRFKEISDIMYLPYDEQLDINPQDDSFLNKKVWDFSGTKKEQYPLLMNFHPLTIYRHQVLKQADTILAHLMLEDYTKESTIKNSYDYYEKITTHDSSLSYCVSSMVACKLGYEKEAYQYFMETARLDLDNTHNNTKDGLHMANMGGSFMGIVYGFAGLRIKEEGISFNPILSDEWEGYQFNIKYLGRVIHIEVNMEHIHICIEGKPLEVKIYEQGYFIEKELTLQLKQLTHTVRGDN